jgi:hypothetical protein
MWVETRLRQWILKGDKNPQHAFLWMVSEAGGQKLEVLMAC